MASRPADPDVAEFAGQLFFRLWRASHTRVAEALATLDLTPASFALLNVLGSRTGANQQETGTLMGIDPSTMVSLIDGLEDAGLAERRPHPKDRRAREVTLTPKGRRVAKRARDLAFDIEDEVLRGLTAPQRREMINLMRRALEGAPPQSPWSETEGD
ncbi:MAG: MarR family transcriptional regulator [Solirubrobacterales bacterium]